MVWSCSSFLWFWVLTVEVTTPAADLASVGVFSRRTNRMQEAQVYFQVGPIGCRKRRYIFKADQSDAGSA
eukprot:6147947-Pyramimonas_sp.AAC.1